MIDRVLHRVGSMIEGTPLETPLDNAYYSVTGPKRTTVTLGDLTAEFNARSSSEYHSSKDFGGEEEVVEAMLHELSDDDILWDIGAFVGWHAALLGQVSETVAFEADPSTFAKLQETCVLNPEARITPVCMGLGNPSGARENVSIVAGEGGEIQDFDSTQSGATIASASTLIDSVLHPPTAVKLDVQGLEGEVLDGFGVYLSEIRLLLVEFHEGRMVGDWSTSTLHNRLTEAGLEEKEELERRKDILRLYVRS